MIILRYGLANNRSHSYNTTNVPSEMRRSAQPSKTAKSRGDGASYRYFHQASHPFSMSQSFNTHSPRLQLQPPTVGGQKSHDPDLKANFSMISRYKLKHPTKAKTKCIK